MLLGSHIQCFHGQLLESEKQFGFVREQQIDVGPTETDQQVRILEIRMWRLALGDRIVKLEPCQAENLVEKLLDARTSFRKRVFLVRHCQFLLFFLGTGFTSTTCGGGAPQFKIHC